MHMEKKVPAVSENEWFIMRVVWDCEGTCTSTEVIEHLKGIKDVSVHTIRVMIGRLVKKGALGYHEDPNHSSVYHYFPLVTEKECLDAKSKRFQNAYFNGKLELMFAAMLENVALSEEETNRLMRLLENKKLDRQ